MRPGSRASETSLTAATPPKLFRTPSTASTGGTLPARPLRVEPVPLARHDDVVAAREQLGQRREGPDPVVIARRPAAHEHDESRGPSLERRDELGAHRADDRALRLVEEEDVVEEARRLTDVQKIGRA